MSASRTTDDTFRIVLIVIAALVLAPILMMVLAFPLMGMWGGGMMGGYGGYGMYGGSSLWGIVMMLVWLVVLVGGGYLLYRWLSGSRGVTGDPAIEELRLAFARGDMSEEEFEARRSKLDDE